MSEQPKGGAAKKASAKKAPAKKNPAKKAPARKAAAKTPGHEPPPEKTASPRKTASQNATANKTTAPRTSKQATKKAAAPVQEADEAQAKDEERPDPTGGLLDAAAGAAGAAVQLAGMPAAAARKVLDAKGGLPAYVGAGVLAVTGIVQWPAAVVGSAGYAALRKWGRQLPEPIRTLTGSAPEQREDDEAGDSERDAPA